VVIYLRDRGCSRSYGTKAAALLVSRASLPLIAPDFLMENFQKIFLSVIEGLGTRAETEKPRFDAQRTRGRSGIGNWKSSPLLHDTMTYKALSLLSDQARRSGGGSVV